jgi:hypothetical protein
VSDADDIINKLNRFVVNTEKAIDDAVFITAHRVRVSAMKNIRDPSFGTIMVRPNGTIHIVSKVGTSPNTDTGRLMGSIKVEHAKGSMVAYVGTSVDYGAFLELLLNRQWLEPALNANIGNYEKTLNQVLDKQIRKAGQ